MERQRLVPWVPPGKEDDCECLGARIQKSRHFLVSLHPFLPSFSFVTRPYPGTGPAMFSQALHGEITGCLLAECVCKCVHASMYVCTRVCRLACVHVCIWHAGGRREKGILSGAFGVACDPILSSGDGMSFSSLSVLGLLECLLFPIAHVTNICS